MSKRYLALIVFIIMSSLIGWQQYIIFSVQKNNTTLKGFLKNNSSISESKATMSGDIEVVKVLGIKETCPRNGSGCTAYSCTLTD